MIKTILIKLAVLTISIGGFYFLMDCGGVATAIGTWIVWELTGVSELKTDKDEK